MMIIPNGLYSRKKINVSSSYRLIKSLTRSSVQPTFGYGNDADVHLTVIFRDHSGLDLDACAIRTECGVWVVGCSSFMSRRQQYHLLGMTVNQIDVSCEVISSQPAAIT